MQLKHHPFLIIISSPSGAGKSTLCKMITKNDPQIKLSISATTRKQRPGEIDGKDYFFISKEKYNQMIDDEQFLEHAHIFDNYYGTPEKMVKDQLKNGNDVLFDIDWQGARQLFQKFKPADIITIFILPPSMDELHKRLQSRAQDNEEVVLKRMEKAKDEVSHYNEYDFVLINDDLEITYQKIHKIISTHRIKRADKKNTKSFVAGLLRK
jgi:guanylate kinase